jgi:carbonic anhydrase
MHGRRTSILLAALALGLLWALPEGAAAEAHWSYGGKWGGTCAIGTSQSPIDIGAAGQGKLPPLKFAWGHRASTIVNNGHTIQVNMPPGSTLQAPGGGYRLVQFHFHHPSEHRIGGKSFPLEIHFVHSSLTDATALAVVGVMVEAGKPNAAFNRVVSTMPAKSGPAVAADAGIDPNGMLPGRRSYYRYAGSLTTPPCSETVDWLVLAAPIQAAQTDIARFAKLYPMNARGMQATGKRTIHRSP